MAKAFQKNIQASFDSLSFDKLIEEKTGKRYSQGRAKEVIGELQQITQMKVTDETDFITITKIAEAYEQLSSALDDFSKKKPADFKKLGFSKEEVATQMKDFYKQIGDMMSKDDVKIKFSEQITNSFQTLKDNLKAMMDSIVEDARMFSKQFEGAIGSGTGTGGGESGVSEMSEEVQRIITQIDELSTKMTEARSKLDELNQKKIKMPNFQKTFVNENGEKVKIPIDDLIKEQEQEINRLDTKIKDLQKKKEDLINGVVGIGTSGEGSGSGTGDGSGNGASGTGSDNGGFSYANEELDRLNNQIDELTQKIEQAKEKLQTLKNNTRDANRLDIGGMLTKAYDSINWDATEDEILKAQQHIVDLYTTYQKVGGSFSEIRDDIFEDIETWMSSEEDGGFNLKGNILDIKVVDENAIQNQTNLINQLERNLIELKNKRDQLIEQLEGQSGGSGAVSGEVTVKAKPDGSNFIQELQEQIGENSVKVNVDIKSTDDLRQKIESSIKNIEIDVTPKWESSISSNMRGWNSADKTLSDLDFGLKERFAVFNNETGYISNPYIVDSVDEIGAELIEKIIKDAKGAATQMIHTHPTNISAFSPEDISMAITALNDGITKSYVMALSDVTSIDLSDIGIKTLLQIEKNFKDKVAAINDDVTKQLEVIGQNNALGQFAMSNSDEYQQKIRNALLQTVKEVGLDPNKILSTVSVDEFVNSFKSDFINMKETIGDFNIKINPVVTDIREKIETELQAPFDIKIGLLDSSKNHRETHQSTTVSTTRPLPSGGSRTVTNTNDSSTSTSGTTVNLDDQARLQSEYSKTRTAAQDVAKAIDEVNQKSTELQNNGIEVKINPITDELRPKIETILQDPFEIKVNPAETLKDAVQQLLNENGVYKVDIDVNNIKATEEKQLTEQQPHENQHIENLSEQEIAVGQTDRDVVEGASQARDAIARVGEAAEQASNKIVEFEGKMINLGDGSNEESKKLLETYERLLTIQQRLQEAGWDGQLSSLPSMIENSDVATKTDIDSFYKARHAFKTAIDQSERYGVLEEVTDKIVNLGNDGIANLGKGIDEESKSLISLFEDMAAAEQKLKSAGWDGQISSLSDMARNQDIEIQKAANDFDRNRNALINALENSDKYGFIAPQQLEQTGETGQIAGGQVSTGMEMVTNGANEARQAVIDLNDVLKSMKTILSELGNEGLSSALTKLSVPQLREIINNNGDLFNPTRRGISKIRKDDLIDMIKTGMSSYTVSTNEGNTFEEDIRSLENYDVASSDFVNELINAVRDGTKQYDDAMNELKAHIEQKQQEIANAARNSNSSESMSELFDPLAILRNEGYQSLVERLEGLNLEQTKQIAKEYGYSRKIRGYTRMTDKTKIADSIYKQAYAKATRGDVFLGPLSGEEEEAGFGRDTLSTQVSLEQIQAAAAAYRELHREANAATGEADTSGSEQRINALEREEEQAHETISAESSSQQPIPTVETSAENSAQADEDAAAAAYNRAEAEKNLEDAERSEAATDSSSSAEASAAADHAAADAANERAQANRDVAESESKLDASESSNNGVPSGTTNTTPTPSVDTVTSASSQASAAAESAASTEVSALDLLIQKLQTVAEAIDAKTDRFRIEAQVVDGVVSGEVNMLDALLGEVNLIVNDLAKLAQAITSLPEIQLRMNEVGEGSTINESVLTELEKIKTVFEKFQINSLDSISDVMDKFNITGDQITNLITLTQALDALIKKIQELSSLNYDGNVVPFIDNLLTKSEELKNLAEILNHTKEQFEEAKTILEANKRTYDEQSAKGGEKVINEQAKKIQEQYEQDDGVITAIQRMYDSHGKLVEAVVTAQKQMKDADGKLKIIQQSSTGIKFGGMKKDENGNEIPDIYTYRRDTDSYSAAQKEYERQINAQVKAYQQLSTKQIQKPEMFTAADSEALRIATQMMNELNEKRQKGIQLTEGETNALKAYEAAQQAVVKVREQQDKKQQEADKKADQKAAQDRYKQLVDIIKQYEQAVSRVNDMEARRASGKKIDPDREKELLEQQANAARDAADAFKELYEMRKNLRISSQDFLDANKTYTDAAKGSQESQNRLANARATAAAKAEEAKQKQIEEENAAAYQKEINIIKEAIKVRNEYNQEIANQMLGKSTLTDTELDALVERLNQTKQAAEEAYKAIQIMGGTTTQGNARIPYGQVKDAEKLLQQVDTGDQKPIQDAQKQLDTKKINDAIKKINEYYEAGQKLQQLQERFASGEGIATTLAKQSQKMIQLKKDAESARVVLENFVTAPQGSGHDYGQRLTETYEKLVQKINETATIMGTNVIQGGIEKQFETAEKGYKILTDNAERYAKILEKQRNKQALTFGEAIFKNQFDGYFKQALKGEGVFQQTADAHVQELRNIFLNAMDTADQNVLTQAFSNIEPIITKLENQTWNQAGIEELEKIKQEYDKITVSIGNVTNASKDSRESMREDLDKIIASISNFSKNSNLYTNAPQDKVNTLNRRISEWIAGNTKATEFIPQMKELQEVLNGDNISAAKYDEVAASFERIRAAAADARKMGLSFGDALKKSFSGLGRYLMTYASFYRVIGVIKQGINVVKEFDAAMTEVRKVTGDSISKLHEWQAGTFDAADIVGGSALQIQKSTASWIRLGKSFSDAQEAAQASVKLLNVSEFTNIDDATTSLLSITQAYKELTYDDVIDKLNMVGDHFSSSTDQLAKGLQNAAAVLKTQGNDIDQALALLAAGNDVTQDISKTSAGVRTIALRISGTEEAKDEIADMGEDIDDFVVRTKSKTDQIIRDYTAVASNAYKGVSVLDANGNLRDTYDILLDIAKVYEEIKAEDKKRGANRAQALVETLAGIFCRKYIVIYV